MSTWCSCPGVNPPPRGGLPSSGPHGPRSSRSPAARNSTDARVPGRHRIERCLALPRQGQGPGLQLLGVARVPEGLGQRELRLGDLRRAPVQSDSAGPAVARWRRWSPPRGPPSPAPPTRRARSRPTGHSGPPGRPERSPSRGRRRSTMRARARGRGAGSGHLRRGARTGPGRGPQRGPGAPRGGRGRCPGHGPRPPTPRALPLPTGRWSADPATVIGLPLGACAMRPGWLCAASAG